MAEQTYTLAQVASKNGEKGAPTWIVVKGVVYDVTEYVEKHPGGAELILEYGGRDATKAFNQAGHSSDAQRDLKKCRIGVLVVETQPMSANHTLKSQMSNATSEEKSENSKCCFCF